MVSLYLPHPKKILKTIICLFTCHIITSFDVKAQDIGCEDYFKNFDSGEPTELLHIYYEQPSEPKGGYANFYELVKEKTHKSSEKGKVFIQFVIDSTGQVQCARVVKTDNELLNDQAIALIEGTEFIPAEQRGKKVVSSMVLPIIFGPEPPKEKKKKRKN